MVKAAVWYKYGEPAVIEEVDIDPVGPGQVKVRMVAAPICGSDIHCVKGEHGIGELPGVAGHEAAGIVEEIGEGVTYVKPGDRVLISLVHAGCGQCYNCIMGNPNWCDDFKFQFKTQSCFTLKDGRRPSSMLGPYASFAEYTLAPERALVKIEEGVPMEVAGVIACGVISGYGAVINAAKVRPLESVAVIAAGGVGLNTIQTARLVGAHPIIAIDPNEMKLEKALEFGATHVVNPKKEDQVARVREITKGRGVDYCFVTCAGIEIKRDAFMMLSRKGLEIIIGHGHKEMMSAWDAQELISGRSLAGSAMGRTKTRVDIPNIMELYKAGRLKLDELISNKYPLEKINEAMKEVEEGKVLRNVITF